NEIWDMLVKQKIIQQNIKKYSIKADEKEIENIMYKKPESLPEEVKSVFYDSKGNFNEDVYLKSIKIDSPDNIKFRENVKNILREDIENNMLMDIVAKDIILSTEELKPGIDDKLKNKLLKKKKVKQFEIWLEEMKLLAKIVDNRKKFEK
ncbi:MAG: hypothetical protein NTU73_15920, partial [Ignavibacteriae bacterium]|nr:hypothetical protein [Ignavibacteriota bacterium]